MQSFTLSDARAFVPLDDFARERLGVSARTLQSARASANAYARVDDCLLGRQGDSPSCLASCLVDRC